MSKKPIFADGKTGGRKASLLTSMAKKTQTALLNLDKNETSPFSGYSFSSNNLATSQVTNGFAMSTTSVENIRLTVQQEVQKYLNRVLTDKLNQALGNQNKSQQGFADEIQKINRQLQTVAKTYEDKNKELFNTFQTARIRHDETTLQNLKIFIGLMKQELTKEFVPMQMLEELELVNLLQNYEDRIEILEKDQGRGGKKDLVGEGETILSKEIQINVGKTIREIEGLRKIITTLTQQKNLLKSQILGINKSIVDITMRNDQQACKIDVIAKQTNEELMSQLARLREQIEDNSMKLNKSMDQLKNIPTLSRLRSDESQNEKEKIEDFRLDNQPITMSFNIPSTDQFRSGFGGNSPSPGKLISLTETSPASRVKQQQGNSSGGPQNLYQIDGEGLLMDEHGQYIMDADGNFIMLTQQQIMALKQSHMLIE